MISRLMINLRDPALFGRPLEIAVISSLPRFEAARPTVSTSSDATMDLNSPQTWDGPPQHAELVNTPCEMENSVEKNGDYNDFVILEIGG